VSRALAMIIASDTGATDISVVVSAGTAGAGLD
jgi:hypothetical protein